MGSIDGNNNKISFGSSKIELGKSDGVKKETFAVGNKENARILNNIFRKFDRNNDGYLDTEELDNYYKALNNAAKDGKMSQSEAEDLAFQLRLMGAQKEHFEQFTKILATENDGVSTEWNGNTCTIKDGDVTLIKEYTNANHNKLSKRTKIKGDTTEVIEFSAQGKTVTTTVGTSNLLVSKKIEEYNSDKKLVKRTEISGDGTTTVTEFDSDGKPKTSTGPEKPTTVPEKPITQPKKSVTEPKNQTTESVQEVNNSGTDTTIKNEKVNTEKTNGGVKNENIDYTKVPKCNQSWIVVLAMKYQDNPPAKEYLDTLAKFPDVSLSEMSNLLKKYPETARWIFEYFESESADKTITNFNDFLDKLGIDIEKEGYEVKYIIHHKNGKTTYRPVFRKIAEDEKFPVIGALSQNKTSSGEKPLGENESHIKFQEIITNQNIS